MSNNPRNSIAWSRLEQLAAQVPTLRELLDTEPDRFEDNQILAPHMRVDLSRQRWTPAVRATLALLAQDADLDAQREQLFVANALNPTEHRAVLHTALRATHAQALMLDGTDIAAEVHTALERTCELADRIRAGHWRGATGKPLTDIVNIGIGGSFLGPALICEALDGGGGPRVHFLANIDGIEATRLLAGLDAERTGFVIASKSFGTLETRINAHTARSWFLERGGRTEDIAHHFLAVSTNLDAAAEFGLPPENLLPMWDWVGGRFSLWSPIGLPIAIAHGSASLRALLHGAQAMDEHFRTAPILANAPIQIALAEIWNQAFLGTRSHAVLPYASALASLPDYLQQLEMESNGKSVRSDGSHVDYDTGTVLWGNVGTNGQHAYHQLLHQGTQPFSAEFILPLSAGHRLQTHHDWLAAHCLAQAEAFARGRSRQEVVAELEQAGLDPAQAELEAPHRVIAGGHPSTLVLLDELDAASLGALIALHEHKVFTQGIIWGINSFDQWGVELGKVLGDRIQSALTAAPDTRTEAEDRLDSTTRALVHILRTARSPRR